MMAERAVAYEIASGELAEGAEVSLEESAIVPGGERSARSEARRGDARPNSFILYSRSGASASTSA